MQRPLKITFRGMQHSDAIESKVRARAAELERYYDSITGCRVTVEAPHRRRHKGNVYAVRIDLDVPGKELVVDRAHRYRRAHEDAYVAIRDAFDAAGRQLEDYAEVRRGDVKRREVPLHGKVTKLFAEDGFGFVETTDGLEVYFHRNSVTNGELAALDIGSEVRIVIAEGEGEQGPQASTITPIGKHHVVG